MSTKTLKTIKTLILYVKFSKTIHHALVKKFVRRTPTDQGADAALILGLQRFIHIVVFMLIVKGIEHLECQRLITL